VGAQLVVIVNASAPDSNVSRDQLRRLFLGQSTRLTNGARVRLIEYAPARGRFYRAAVGLPDDLVRRHWIATVFAGEPVTPPREFDDPDAVVRFVAEHPEALGFLDRPVSDPNVRVLTIDGQSPSSQQYPLR
jgi:hypothetical protein